jgi:hypothetical protein
LLVKVAVGSKRLLVGVVGVFVSFVVGMSSTTRLLEGFVVGNCGKGFVVGESVTGFGVWGRVWGLGVGFGVGGSV